MPTIKYYYISITITYVLVVTFILTYLSFFQGIIPIPECGFYVHTGFYCPACGCTRAIIALKNMNIINSLKYNPTVFYTFFFSTLFIIIETFNTMFKKDFQLPWKNIVRIGLIILFLNWIIQNIIILISKIS